jgi:nucleoside-diphosphate-sugar epimerase
MAARSLKSAQFQREVIAVSRFSDQHKRDWLAARGIRTHSCDILDPDEVAKLPDASQVLFLVGMKFGTAQNPAATWATNTLAPAAICRRYRGVPIVALSTGNVYPFSTVASRGSVETNPLTPLGEYANAAVARERIFEYFSREHRTPVVLLRLNYAVELRYGVLVDIALKVARGEPVDVTQGFFNCIWQGDANAWILRSLAWTASPAEAFNLTGSEIHSVRETALAFGELLGRDVSIVGAESDTALLSNSARLREMFGEPATPHPQVLRWTADWIARGAPLLGKPTHFEVRDGKY